MRESLMTTTVRNFALQSIVLALCGLIALNAFLVWKNFRRMDAIAGQRVQASDTRAAISDVALDFRAIESSHRGYLLTGDAAYLEPFHEATEKLSLDLARLRPRLTGKGVSLESQLESVAESKIAEMNETVRLRQQGYRHRAFVIMASNRDQQRMEEAQAALQGLSAAQAGNLAAYDREMRQAVPRALAESTLASAILLMVTILTFAVLNRFRKRLEVEYVRQGEQLRATSVQLEQLNSTIFQQFRSLVAQVREHANTLLNVYGGFLPRQGQEKAELIEDRAAQMIRLIDGSSNTSGEPEFAAEAHAELHTVGASSPAIQ